MPKEMNSVQTKQCDDLFIQWMEGWLNDDSVELMETMRQEYGASLPAYISYLENEVPFGRLSGYLVAIFEADADA